MLEQIGQVHIHRSKKSPADFPSTPPGTLARDAGDYREYPVVPALRDHFSCVWVNRLADTAPASIVVVPDGAIDLQWIAGQWRIAGPDEQAQPESVPAGALVIGFRFQPGTAHRWLGVAASELCNQRILLRDILGPSGDQIDAPARGDSTTRFELERVLSRWTVSMPCQDREIIHAHRLLSGGAPPGINVVPWLMKELSMSERTLRRRFDAAVGYGPKTLDRILRFQRYLDLARTNNGMTASRRAAAVGYADQAHLVRECRRLALCTPGEIG
jgi:AraC-like DNA-binding protein